MTAGVRAAASETAAVRIRGIYKSPDRRGKPLREV